MDDQKLRDAQDRLRRRMFPRFFHFARGLKSAIVDFCEGGSEDPLAPVNVERYTANLSEANCVSSYIEGSGDDRAEDEAEWRYSTRHKPVLDIDIPCLLLDSSTPDNHHLFIDKEMSWRQYMRLLEVLGDVGILEPGYVHASINRNASWVRVPWVKKKPVTTPSNEVIF